MSTPPCSMDGITAAALTTGLIVTCRPALVNRPSACAMYRPALASAGTTATTRSGFSGRAALAGPPGLPLPHAAAATTIPAAVTAARARRHDRRPWPVFRDPLPAPGAGRAMGQGASVMPGSSADADDGRRR